MEISISVDRTQITKCFSDAIQQAMVELLSQNPQILGALSMTEAEAASVLGLNERQLADERRRGQIVASRIVGNRIRYQPADVLNYLQSRREKPQTAGVEPDQVRQLIPHRQSQKRIK